MASEVEICNLALSHLGDEATVASITPPDGSVQAGLCARHYPLARDALLQMHTWTFATRRIVGAEVSSGTTNWQYAYSLPNDALDVFAVLPPEATNPYSRTAWDQLAYNDTGLNPWFGAPPPSSPMPVPVDYELETDADGNILVMTNQPTAEIRYSVRITDTAKFSPLFVRALGHLLAADIAGPLLKGDVGAAEAKKQLQLFQLAFNMAVNKDAKQRQLNVGQRVPWIAGR